MVASTPSLDDHDEEEEEEEDGMEEEEEVVVRMSLKSFPGTKRIKDEAGLPWGCTVHPLAERGCAMQRWRRSGAGENAGGGATTSSLEEEVEPEQRFLDAHLVPRCTDCYAYLSRPCYVDRWGWRCCLCGSYATWPAPSARRKKTTTSSERRRFERAGRCELYETQNDVTDLEVFRRYVDIGASIRTPPPALMPLTLFVVDGNLENMAAFDCMRSALDAALTALEPSSFVGVIFFQGNELLVLDIHNQRDDTDNDADENTQRGEESSGAIVRRFPLMKNFDIADCLDVDALVAPTKDAHAIVLHASDALRPLLPTHDDTGDDDTQSKRASTGNGGRRTMTDGATRRMRKRRRYGSAVCAVLNLLESSLRQNDHGGLVNEHNGDDWSEGDRPTYVNAKVVSLLFGAPDAGRGAVDTSQMADAVAEVERTRSASRKTNNDSDTEEVIAEEEMHLLSLSPVGSFYRDAGARACMMGVSLDVFLVVADSEGGYADVAAIRELAAASGGMMLYYGIASNGGGGDVIHTLARDVSRLLSRSFSLSATNCLMRIRTSSEFRVRSSYGNLCSDEHGEVVDAGVDKGDACVYRTARCSTSSYYCFDFDFSSLSGFCDDTSSEPFSTRGQYSLPVVQVALQYDVYTPVARGGGKSTKMTQDCNGTSIRWQQVRRMRIITMQTDVCWSLVSPDESGIYVNVDISVVLELLMHKLLCEQRRLGSSEARMLAHDWLALLVASVDRISGVRSPRRGRLRRRGGGDRDARSRRTRTTRVSESGSYGLDGMYIDGDSDDDDDDDHDNDEHDGLGGKRDGVSQEEDGKRNHVVVDASMSSQPALQPLVRLVFGLIRSPLLNIDRAVFSPGVSAASAGAAMDATLSAAYVFMSSSDSDNDVQRYLYPILTSFSNSRTLLRPRHPLSRRSVVSSNGNIFLLDSGTTIVVYCTQQYRFRNASIRHHGARVTEGNAARGMEAGAAGGHEENDDDDSASFPPHPDSLLEKTVRAIVTSRIRAPSVFYVVGGEAGAEMFEHRMLEDDLGDFLDEIARTAESYMRDE